MAESGCSANKPHQSIRSVFHEPLVDLFTSKQPYRKLQAGQWQPYKEKYKGQPHQTLSRKQLPKINIGQPPSPVLLAQCFRAIMKALAPV